MTLLLNEKSGVLKFAVRRFGGWPMAIPCEVDGAKLSLDVRLRQKSSTVLIGYALNKHIIV